MKDIGKTYKNYITMTHNKAINVYIYARTNCIYFSIWYIHGLTLRGEKLSAFCACFEKQLLFYNSSALYDD